MISGLISGKEKEATGLESFLRNQANQWDTMSNQAVGDDKAKRTFGDLTNIISEQIPSMATAGVAGKVVSAGTKLATPLLTKVGTNVATKAPKIANIAAKNNKRYI